MNLKKIDDNIAAMDRRLTGATKGPWTSRGQEVRAIAAVADCCEGSLASVVGPSQIISRTAAARNATFIAHSRTDMERLLGVAKAVVALHKLLKKELKQRNFSTTKSNKVLRPLLDVFAILEEK